MKVLWSKIAGFTRRYLIPNFLLGKEKAVGMFLAPFVLAQLSRLFPSLNADPALLAQLVTAILLSVTTHQITNTPGV